MAKPVKKVTRKELLKEPDEFITFSGKLIAFGRQYQRQLVYGAAALCILLVVFTATRYFSQRADAQAFALLDGLSRQYAAALQEKGPDGALEAVEDGFENLLQDYGGRSGGRLARIRYGDICYAAGRIERAVALYQDALGDFAQDPFYRGLLLINLGYAHRQQGNQAEAIRHFQQVAEMGGAPLKAEALFVLGDLYTGAGQSNQAQAAYRQIVDEFPQSTYADVAQEQISG